MHFINKLKSKAVFMLTGLAVTLIGLSQLSFLKSCTNKMLPAAMTVARSSLTGCFFCFVFCTADLHSNSSALMCLYNSCPGVLVGNKGNLSYTGDCLCPFLLPENTRDVTYNM